MKSNGKIQRKCRKVSYDLYDDDDRGKFEWTQWKLKEKTGVIPNGYFCDECQSWHIGYNKEKRKKFHKAARKEYQSLHGENGKYPERTS